MHATTSVSPPSPVAAPHRHRVQASHGTNGLSGWIQLAITRTTRTWPQVSQRGRGRASLGRMLPASECMCIYGRMARSQTLSSIIIASSSTSRSYCMKYPAAVRAWVACAYVLSRVTTSRASAPPPSVLSNTVYCFRGPCDTVEQAHSMLHLPVHRGAALFTGRRL